MKNYYQNKKRYHSHDGYRKSKIHGFKCVMMTVLSIFFAIGFGAMWYGIKHDMPLLTLLTAFSVAACFLLAVYKWIKARHNYNTMY